MYSCDHLDSDEAGATISIKSAAATYDCKSTNKIRRSRNATATPTEARREYSSS